MPWKPINARWSDYAEAFGARFPETDAKTVARLQGDLIGLREYLAIAHDLTLSEAAEAVDAWAANLVTKRSEAA